MTTDNYSSVVAHATLDCETAGLGARPVLLSIAFVPVAVDGTVLKDDWLLLYPDVTSQILKGRTITPETINWWNGDQVDPKAKAIWGFPRISVEETLDTIDYWFKERTRKGLPILVWGNGSEHDNVWVESLYHDFGRMPPWAYWQNQSLRTLRTLFKPQLRNVPSVGTMHVAEDDALYEANCLSHLLIGRLIPNTQHEEFELAAIRYPMEDRSAFAKSHADDEEDDAPATNARRRCPDCGDPLLSNEVGPNCDECTEEDDE